MPLCTTFLSFSVWRLSLKICYFSHYILVHWFLAQTPRFGRFMQACASKTRHGKVRWIVSRSKETDFPKVWKAELAGPYTSLRIIEPTELSRQPENPSPTPDQCDPHLSGSPPLLGPVGCECHHPRRPEGRRHNWGRGTRELGRTFKPDTTLNTSKLQSLNESQGRSYCEIHIDDLVFKSPKESQTDLSNGFRASLTQREGFQVRQGQF